MTTIAYKDRVIAYDSRFTRDGVIVSDEGSKKVETEDNIFFLAGAEDEWPIFIEAYEKGAEPKFLPKVSALVACKNTKALYYAGCWTTDGGAVAVHRAIAHNPEAIGSGRSFALAAMDCGKSAVEAVNAAAKRCIYTGGTINSYTLSKP